MRRKGDDTGKEVPCFLEFGDVFLFACVQYRAPSDDDDVPMPTAIQQFYDCLIQSIDAVKAWADRVPGFAELCKHDQDQLFQTAALELVMLRIAYTCRSARAL